MKDTTSTINAFNNPRVGDKTSSFSLFKAISATVGFIFKTFVWLGVLGGVMFGLQFASLEICSRAGVFPLYGFFITNLLYAIFLVGIYRISKHRFRLPQINPFAGVRNFKQRIAAGISISQIKRKKPNTKQIPAVLLIIKRRQAVQPKKNSVSAKQNEEKL